jgi:TRAP-type mannitol/chloroaromatic compound transport system substrate-binding protein
MMKRLVIACMVFAMTAAVAFTGYSDGMAAASGADKQITWRVQGYGGAGTLYDAYAKRLTDRITELSAGRLTIDFYPADAIFAASEVPNAARDGIVDAVYTYGGQYTGVNEAFALLCATPGMFPRPFDLLTYMKEGGGVKILQDMLDAYNMNQKVLLCGVHDAEIFLWSNKPIREIEDMKGLTLRFMPVFGNILSAHGMSCVSLPATEIIPALERGVIDAGEYSIPAYDITMGFQDVAKYAIVPGFHQPSSAVTLNVNKASWDALPDELKRIVEAACNENIVRFFTDQRMRNVEALDKIRAAKVEIVAMSAKAIATLNQWTAEYINQKAASNEWVKRVRDSERAFVKEMAGYMDSLDFQWPDWARK